MLNNRNRIVLVVLLAVFSAVLAVTPPRISQAAFADFSQGNLYAAEEKAPAAEPNKTPVPVPDAKPPATEEDDGGCKC